MIAKSMIDYVKGSSVIRAMFEEGKKIADKFGAENVYDFTVLETQALRRLQRLRNQLLTYCRMRVRHMYTDICPMPDMRM